MALDPAVARLMENARSRLPGATDTLIQYELFNVMDDFFKGSNTWQEDIDIQVPGLDPVGTIYELTPSGPSIIDKLMWVFSVPPTSTIGRGCQIGSAMSTPGELTLTLQPSSPVTYRATVALTVQDPTTRDGYVTFPAWVLAKYRAVILDGLLGKMMSQPQKPWSNTQLAVLHMRKFNTKVASARVEMTRNNKYRQQAWMFPGFASGSQRSSSGWGGPV